MADLDALRNKMKERKKVESLYSSQNVRQMNSIINNGSQDAEYHYHLAVCYEKGEEGFEFNVEKAFSEYLIAAELGHSEAMLEVAFDYAYSYSSVLGYDLAKAEKWAKRAIDSGNADGYYIIFNILNQQNKGRDAIKQLELGVSKGSLRCIEMLSFHLYWGYKDEGYEMPDDEDRAFGLLTAVNWDEEHPLALELLGDLYRNREDYSNAIKYYEKVLKIKPDDYSVMERLGTLLRSEEQVMDYNRAKSLLKKAAENGEKYAMNGLGVMLYLGEGGEKDEQASIEWMKKAAQEGMHRAMINLYDILCEDKPDEAKYWLTRAADEGNEEAINRLQEIQKEDVGVSDTSRSDQIYDFQLSNLENTLKFSQSSFSGRISDIQKVIDQDELSDYEADRLRLLEGVLSLLYFREHFCDDDFDDSEKYYFEILDKVDDFVKSMSSISDEAAYLYHVANMYSADRYKDIRPIDKLEELWKAIQEIELDESVTEFKVSFWKETAQEIYDLMYRILCPSDSKFSSSTSSNLSNDDYIKNKVISIVADKLTLDKNEIHTYSELSKDLGADSLDAIELIMEMEKEFGMTIPDNAAQRIETVGDIITYIQCHR